MSTSRIRTLWWWILFLWIYFKWNALFAKRNNLPDILVSNITRDLGRTINHNTQNASGERRTHIYCVFLTVHFAIPPECMQIWVPNLNRRSKRVTRNLTRKTFPESPWGFIFFFFFFSIYFNFLPSFSSIKLVHRLRLASVPIKSRNANFFISCTNTYYFSDIVYEILRRLV